MFLGSLFSKTTCLKLAIVLLLAQLLTTTPVHAQAQQPASPPQATCITPSGEIIVSYENGTHGIVGNPSTFVGRDDVYSLGEEGALQCFCAEDNGIETIWWGSIQNLTREQIAGFTSSGWILVPNGFLWGLEAKPYLTKNTNYTCSSSVQGGTVQSTSDSTSGDVLGISTLPATGSVSQILMLFGLVLTGVGVWQLAGVLQKRKA